MKHIPPKDQKQIFGHPIGLFVLFTTEMWERFSYYGMRALLVLYMTKYLIIEGDKGMEIFGYNAIKAWVAAWLSFTGMTNDMTTQIFASNIYGLYTGFVYFTPFFGGILADRILGQGRTVYLGAILMAIGHFLMAIESMFFVALFFLILGNGAFKPNISTQVGSLYEPGDSRRDGAFVIFYQGINLGAMFSPLVCGTLGQKVGWHWGFGAAGVGMMLGLLVYHFGRRYLPQDHLTQLHEKEVQTGAKINEGSFTLEEWKRIGTLAFLCMVNIVFWAVYEQQGNTMQLWADERTDWVFGGWEVPSTWYQSLNPIMIVLLPFIIMPIWRWQDKKGKQPGSVTKMGIGCILLGSAFIVMIAASRILGPEEKGSVMWLFWLTLLLSIGEIFLSPIGLSLVTKVAPVRAVSMMMGVWLMSSFFGNYLSGYLGGYYDLMTKEAFFTMLTALGVGAGLVFFAVKRPLVKIIGRST